MKPPGKKRRKELHQQVLIELKIRARRETQDQIAAQNAEALKRQLAFQRAEERELVDEIFAEESKRRIEAARQAVNAEATEESQELEDWRAAGRP